MISNPIPDVTADSKVIRRLFEAIAECVDSTIETLLDDPDLDIDIDQEDDEVMGALADYLLDLATQGEAVWPS